MRTAEEYLEGLKSMRPNVYMGGEVLNREKVPGQEILMATFELACLPEHEGIFTTTSHLTGRRSTASATYTRARKTCWPSRR